MGRKEKRRKARRKAERATEKRIRRAAESHVPGALDALGLAESHLMSACSALATGDAMGDADVAAAYSGLQDCLGQLRISAGRLRDALQRIC